VTPILCFDLETVPDVAGLRRLNPEWAELDDAAVAERAFAERRERTGGSDFLQHHLHRIVAIGCAFRDDSGFRVRCLGTHEDGEGKLIQDFFKLIDRYTPQLVSWNGGGFDLPVLHYRGLLHGVSAARYWDQGEDDRDFKWNNYISRYHARHTDLMDLLALYQPRAAAPLDDLAKLCGFAGKLGMDGSRVWDACRGGDLGRIRDYCETDVVNTYLVFCRFQKMRGRLSDAAYAQEMAVVRKALAEHGDAPHWREFLTAWHPD
jgi:predicted PolB exonuclease-like 3'-5' exonuclease